MIGFYDYTVILTYLSLLSAVTGIGLAVAHHPLLAILCLMFSGLCDMFDGRVARTKKNRTAEQKGFGIQIDSLCDIVAFGILPAVITIVVCGSVWYAVLIAALYVLAGLIRLAYFNVTEELRQQAESLCRRMGEIGVTAEVVSMENPVGGGAAPTQTLPSFAVAVAPRDSAAALEAQLRQRPVPIIVRIAHDRCLLDMRALFPADLDEILQAFREIAS